MKRLFIFLAVLIKGSIILGQNYASEPPVHYPVASSVWQFTKFGDVGVNEYRGLANISIPLYNLTIDDFSLPLSLDYFSGGIRVSEEASDVGLGWSLNIPTVIESVKDKPDYYYSTKFAKLPPVQGSPVWLSPGVYPTESNPEYSTNIQNPQPLIGYQEMPVYCNSLAGIVIDHDGYYDVDGKYRMMMQQNVYDTEPDIFSVNINGVTIKFCRGDSNQNPNSMLSGNELLPLHIINGRTEYQVALIPKSTPPGPADRSNIEGIIVIDPSRNTYFFKTLDTSESDHLTVSISYKLSQVITNKGKIIDFNYGDNLFVREFSKISNRYTRRTSATSIHNTSVFAGMNSEPLLDFNGFYDFYGQGNFRDNSNIESAYNRNMVISAMGYNYNCLSSINSPEGEITFGYGDRLDLDGMKKLENIQVTNIFNQVIKHWDMEYDYFVADGNVTNSGSNNGEDLSFDLDDNGQTTYTVPVTPNLPNIERVIKKLKLLSVKESGQNPYLFEYNDTTIPKKNSTSIDYWGFYNGHANANLKPDLSELGYPNLTENAANGFGANLTYCKAATLEKIVYPTSGYSLFTYSLNQFDNLLYNAGPDTPVINTGGGLRIDEIANYNFDGTPISKKKYTYYGGKNISKRILTFDAGEKWAYCDDGADGEGSVEYSTQFISASINNYLNSSEDSEGDYIGYSRVEITDDNFATIGKTEKIFSNNENRIVKLLNCIVNSGKYYSARPDLKNGTLLHENIYGNGNVLLIAKTFNYSNVGFQDQQYGMSIRGNGVRAHTNLTTHCEQVNVYPRSLLTFYPIYDKFSRMTSQSVTEKFNGLEKTIVTTYGYDNSNNINNICVTEPGAIFQNRNISNELDSWYFKLPLQKIKKVNDIIAEVQKFTYEPFNNYQRLKKIEVFPEGNLNLNQKTLYYDAYDDVSNVLQYHTENGLTTCVVWGYNKTLPIAKIESKNVTYSQLQNYCDIIQTASNTDDENALLSAMADFRTSVDSQFPNTLITTYTHKPLIGVSTITDPKGDKIKYDYDDYGRLKDIRDKDDNILSENEYNYKPQN